MFSVIPDPVLPFFNASADRMNTSPLDLPWYLEGCECIESFRMDSVRSSSSSASSSSLDASVSAEANVGGATISGEEVRWRSAARDPLACGCSDDILRVRFT